MKISCVRFKNHPILGNLEIDFCKNSEKKLIGGEAYDDIAANIIFVGENGSGKTTLLRELHNYQKSEFIVDNQDKDKWRGTTSMGVYDEGRFAGYGHVESIFLRYDLKYKEALDDFNNDFSRKIASGGMRSPTFSNYAHLNGDGIKQVFNNDRLSKAFEEAQKFGFEEFASNPRPKTILDYSDNLSSGEREILMRVLYMTKKHQISVTTDFLLIDEPENSLHPRWQLEILGYFKKLVQLVKKTEVPQHIQLFVASHSENILKSAIEQGDWMILQLYKDGNNIIQCKRIEQTDMRLPTITFAEIKYIVFGIASTDYHNALYGYLQNKVGIKTIKEIDQYIAKQKSFNEDIHGKTTDYNETTYKTICTYIRNEIHHPQYKVLFDETQLRLSIELLRQIILDLFLSMK